MSTEENQHIKAVDQIRGIPVCRSPVHVDPDSSDGDRIYVTLPTTGKWIALWQDERRLTNDGYYVGTALVTKVVALIDGDVLSHESVRMTRYKRQRPRLFAAWRLKRAMDRAARLLSATA